jgi:hypothetical protein
MYKERTNQAVLYICSIILYLDHGSIPLSEPSTSSSALQSERLYALNTNRVTY